MVLMVMIEFLLPKEKEVMGLVEAEWRGSWDEDGNDDDRGESDINNDEGGFEGDAMQLDGVSPQSAQYEVRQSVNRGWLIAGLGRREIVDIARYLLELDAEEMKMDNDGLVEEGRGDRWMRLMKWPLEMAQGDAAARVAHDYRPQNILYKKNSGI